MADRIFAVFLIGLWASVWYISRDYPFKSNIVPWGVTGFMSLLSLFFMVKPEPVGKIGKLGQVFLFLIAMLITISLMDKIGFILALGFFVCTALLVQGIRSVRTILTLTIFTVIAVYLVFYKLLSVPLPTFFK